MFLQSNKLKIALTYLLVIVLVFSRTIISGATESDVETDTTYDKIEFLPKDEGEEDEMVHLLFAKLAYDYLDGYEGKTVSEYVSDNPDLYAGEIWEDSGITYENLYNSIVGKWTIYKVFNSNRVSGFYAVAFLSEDRVILAIRGSDMFTDEFPLDESNDWIFTDFRFAIMNELSSQFDDFDGTYKLLKRYMKADGYDDYTITLTGHSLGGALVVYGSLTTDCFGYSFDGACGHVVDLIYMEEYLKIDNYTGIDDIDNVKFVNYTDETGYLVADIIQHTGTDCFYQIDRVTNLEGLNENNFISQVADAGSHHIWSCLTYEGNVVSFTEKVKVNDYGYTYMPEGYVYMDITRNIVEAFLEEFNIFSPWEMLWNFDLNNAMSTLMGEEKNGTVILLDKYGEYLDIEDYAWGEDENSYSVDTVVYGGVGDDGVVTGAGDDVFILGGGSLNQACGGDGDNTYVVDYISDQELSIVDNLEGDIRLIFRNPNVDFLKGVTVTEEIGYDKIKLPNGQSVNLNFKEGGGNCEVYIYDDKLIYLGTYQEFLDKYSN